MHPILDNVKSYAGIGSRETPEDVCAQMSLLAGELSSLGYVLRSGAAPGADRAFESGCTGPKQIFVPWPGFGQTDQPCTEPPAAAWDVARQFHPAWDRLSPAAKKLMARNSCQVLGPDMNDPSEFVVCWTRDGKASGGTGQAIRIARAYGIPVFNLHRCQPVDVLRHAGKFSLF